MSFLIEYASELVLILLFVILFADMLVIAVAVGRRRWRKRYFQRIDALRERCTSMMAGLCRKDRHDSHALATLKALMGNNRPLLVEKVIAESRPKATELPSLHRFCEDLGLVTVWQQDLIGNSENRFGVSQSLSQARAAESLGLLRHRPSWPLLVRALDNPHLDVQSAALRALGAIQEARSYPHMLERLQAAVLDSRARLPLRSIQSTLASFPVERASHLIPWLTHAHWRLRFLATEIIREMVEREAALAENFVLEPKNFPLQLRQLFLTQLCADENPDVRARAAAVIARLQDPSSTAALTALMEDTEWFVRLRAVRAMSRRKCPSQAAAIARRLTDSHWMVREAAVRTLLALGDAGIDEVLDHCRATRDRYAREQIADELHRSERIPALLNQYACAADDKAARLIGLLVEMGRTNALLVALRESSHESLRKKFIEDFGPQIDPATKQLLQGLAAQEPDTALRAQG